MAMAKTWSGVTFLPPGGAWAETAAFAKRGDLDYWLRLSMSVFAANELASATKLSAVDSIGFKDWSLICDALGQGRQSLILRKGGIAEGRDGFRFKHEAFFLFPTQYHQQAERVRPEELPDLRRTSRPREGTVELRYFFALEWAEWLSDWEAVARLEPLHVWREDVVRERFAYDEQRGLQCACGRVYRLETPWIFPDRAAYGGCRSWVTLPEFPAQEITMQPVLDDQAHAEILRETRAKLSGETLA